MAAERQPVRLSDIEARIRALTGDTTEVIRSARAGVITGGVVVGALLIALSFIFGRRRGRQRSTILEIYQD